MVKNYAINLTDEFLKQIVDIYCDIVKINRLDTYRIPTVKELLKSTMGTVERRYGSQWSGHSKFVINPIHIIEIEGKKKIVAFSHDIYFYHNMYGEMVSLHKYEQEIKHAEKTFKDCIHELCQQLHKKQSKNILHVTEYEDLKHT